MPCHGVARTAVGPCEHFTKDIIEQKLFDQNRDLFTSLQLVFYTTSIYGVLLDAYGRPICCELLPGNITDSKPLELSIKEVVVEKRRCIICHNPEQAKKDVAGREAIVASLRNKMKQGDRSLAGNKGYRKYLKSSDPEEIEIQLRPTR